MFYFSSNACSKEKVSLSAFSQSVCDPHTCRVATPFVKAVYHTHVEFVLCWEAN